jgi:hypothetical protein
MTRFHKPFNSRTAMLKFWPGYVGMTPLMLDWETAQSAYFNGNGPLVEIYSAVRCEDCGKIVTNNGSSGSHNDVTNDTDCEGWIESTFPMMNYGYAISAERVGGLEAAARLLVDLPVCLVEYDDVTYLALTGGGMDLSWELAQAYLLLGWLPPLEFCDLSSDADPLTAARRWVMRGARASIRSQMQRMDSLKRKLDHTADRYKRDRLNA